MSRVRVHDKQYSKWKSIHSKNWKLKHLWEHLEFISILSRVPWLWDWTGSIWKLGGVRHEVDILQLWNGKKGLQKPGWFMSFFECFRFSPVKTQEIWQEEVWFPHSKRFDSSICLVFGGFTCWWRSHELDLLEIEGDQFLRLGLTSSAAGDCHLRHTVQLKRVVLGLAYFFSMRIAISSW